MRVPGPIERQWRRWFGRYEIDDPRPIAEEAPYTYYLPSENELLALGPGDLAQIVFRSIPPSGQYDAERMWVLITATDGDGLTGALENTPLDMPQLRTGDVVRFKRSDVISVLWSDERATPPPPAPERRDYWERCFVDRCVVEEGVSVYYLYREEADPDDPDDKYPDSGWRIRGDFRGLDDETIEARKIDYLALGAVLNHDDSWLHLIDSPVGSAFIQDEETGRFEPCED